MRKCVFSLKGDKHKDICCVCHKVISPIILNKFYFSGRRGHLMVCALDDPGSSAGRGHCVVSRSRHFTLAVPLFTQVNKWASANSLLCVTLRWTSIPSRGGVEILLVSTDGPLGSYADFTLPTSSQIASDCEPL